MTELGARLKEARERKGYSLDDLQEITKIQKRYLIGIEEGNFSGMPGSFYVRAFIKQYAEAVDLNPDELLEQFKSDLPASQSTDDVVQSYSTSHSRKKLASTKNKGLNEAMPKLIVALFAVVIVAVIAVLVATKMNETPPEVADDKKEYEYEPPKVTEPAEDKDSETDGDTTETSDEEEPAEPEVKQVISPGVVNGEDVTYEVSNTDSLKIRVELSGLSWVGIRDENRNEKIDARAYNAGDVVEYDSTEDGYARIRLGAATYTKVFVNDEEVPKVSDRTTQNFIIKLVKEEEEE